MKLSESELKVLKTLQEGKKRYSELAEEIKMSPGGLTKLLKRLQKEGLIRRIQENIGYPPPVYYEITEKGRVTLEAESAFMVLLEFNEEEALKLLEELKKAISTRTTSLRSLHPCSR